MSEILLIGYLGVFIISLGFRAIVYFSYLIINKNKRKQKKMCSKCLSKKGCTLTPKLDCWCFTRPLKVKIRGIIKNEN